ncbi:MAG: hypothetical protein CW691_09905 [Candidatus Bathyarchaeum sp.]|nr:MAG: hypothetical protein CW691_09905 [Candidatus Bathyarchaeum sp.]
MGAVLWKNVASSHSAVSKPNRKNAFNVNVLLLVALLVKTYAETNKAKTPPKKYCRSHIV